MGPSSQQTARLVRAGIHTGALPNISDGCIPFRWDSSRAVVLCMLTRWHDLLGHLIELSHCKHCCSHLCFSCFEKPKCLPCKGSIYFVNWFDQRKALIQLCLYSSPEYKHFYILFNYLTNSLATSYCLTLVGGFVWDVFETPSEVLTCTQRFCSPGATERVVLLFVQLFYGCRKFYCTIFFSFSLPLPLSLFHTPFPLLSMEWCMSIVSVVAEGPCLCSASLYSFVKCGFGRRLVGRVQGGRWQQQASLFLSPSLLLPLSSP